MRAKVSGSAKRTTTPVQPTRPVRAQSTQVKPQVTRAPQQFRGTAVGTGSRVPESAIRADESLGRTSQERSFTQHYGVMTPIADVSISQLQGNKPKNISYGYGAHTGVDFSAPIGTDVRGMKEGGVVKFAGPNGAYGNQVVIEYPDGTSSAFNHLDSANVKVGQRIEKGENFAKSGNTGHTTGPHLDLQSINNDGIAAAPDKIFNRTSIMGTSQFDDSWKGGQTGVNEFTANIGQSPSGGGTFGNQSENGGPASTRSDSFTSGNANSGVGFGQQVNLAALNQTYMRRPRSTTSSVTTPLFSSPVGYVPPQTTNSGTVTSIRNT